VKLNEIRGLGSEELNAKIIDLKAVLAKERASVASGTRAENPGKIKKIRREVARMFTVITERAKGIKVEKKVIAKKEKIEAKKETAKEVKKPVEKPMEQKMEKGLKKKTGKLEAIKLDDETEIIR